MQGFDYQSWLTDAPVTGASVDTSGRVAAFAGGDGVVRLASLCSERALLPPRPLSDGAILALAPDCHSGSFLAGADDGAVYRFDAHGADKTLLRLRRAWPDQLLAHGRGILAVADGPDVQLLDGMGEPTGVLGAHPSTVAGLVFDQDGQRLAVSHYDGVSIWQLSDCDRTTQLRHRGSHLDIVWSPDGRYVVTSTQEKMLHAWDLHTDTDLSLGPSFNKVKSLGWSADGAWLLAAGNDTLSAWQFTSEGLPGPAPKMLGRFSEDLIGGVCPHPLLPVVAVAYNDGALDLTAISMRSERAQLVAPDAASVVAMAWSPDGDHLIGGKRTGEIFVYRLDEGFLKRLSPDCSRP